MKALVLVFGVIGLAGLGLIAGGFADYHDKTSGERVQAKVTGCQVESDSTHATEVCSGSWVAGGDLVGGNGHVVLGVIDDATPSEIGKTLSVRANGDEAFTSSLTTPIALWVLGLLLTVASVVLMIAGGRESKLEKQSGPIPTIQPPTS